MFVQPHPVDAQAWIIRICGMLPTQTLHRIIREISMVESDVSQYLSQCMIVAQEQKESADYCTDFDSTCRTIVKVIRTKKKDSDIQNILQKEDPDIQNILQKDYVELMQTKSGTPLSNEEAGRIKRGKGKLHIETVWSLCNRIQDVVLRRFWENQLLICFPSVSEKYEERESRLELDGLEKLLKLVPKRRLDAMCEEDPELDKLCEQTNIVDRFSDSQENPHRAVVSLLKENKMNLDQLSLDELMIGEGTWDNWRKKWEKNRNSSKYAPGRIPRWAMLYIAVRFDLSYLEMLRFLQMAGYRPGYSALDLKIRRYFAAGEGDREELLQTLRLERPK